MLEGMGACRIIACPGVQIAESLPVPFHEVDARNVVPCWVASEKREYGARTIRPKIHKNLPEFLVVRPHAWLAACLLLHFAAFKLSIQLCAVVQDICTECLKSSVSP